MSAAIVFLAAVAGVFGLAIGSFLNVVAYRVPAGISLLRESRCPSCQSPVRWWQNVPVASWMLLGGRCASCRASISARYPLVELCTGLVFAGVALWWATSAPYPVELSSGLASLAAADQIPRVAQFVVLTAYLWFAGCGIALTLIDLDTHRLPHPITTVAFVTCLAMLTAACVLGADWWALARAVAGAIALYLAYAALRFVRPDAMGGGDVRLAAVVGLMLGWIGWGALAVGAFAAFVLGGVFGIALLLGGRAGRRTAIPFGPWMIAGAWVGVVAGEPLSQAYTSLIGVA